MKKIILLNPPGKHLYIRDYFCSKISQADYIPPPVDLVMLSGTLGKEYNVFLVDAIAGKLSIDKTVEEIKNISPWVIISLFGSVSFEEDFNFVLKVKNLFPEIKIIGVGDVFWENGEKYLAHNSPIEAVLYDFTTEDIIHYLKSKFSEVKNMLIRVDSKIVSTAVVKKHGYYNQAIPRHDLFLKYNYRHPFIRGKQFVSTLTEYGCPFPCDFCIMGTLGHKARNIENIISELEYIKSLGVKEILFHTQTFGANLNLTKELCGRLIEGKFNFSWVCFSRVDVVTPDLLEMMKKAGCHTIIFGVESGSDEILRKYNKKYTTEQIISTIDYCNKIGLETVGTFILGLPEENYSTINHTLNLLKRLKLDYASFNVAVPRLGTNLRKEAIALGLIDDNFKMMDQSGSKIAMPTTSLNKEKILKYRRKAVCLFYLRPKYLLGRLKKISSFQDFVRQLRQAVRLLINTWI